MEDETGRQAACDRCRGQKLRCVGVVNPIFRSRSRLQRSEIPCERCKRAKVVCYSIRPVPRRTLPPDANKDRTLSVVSGSSPDPDGPLSVLMSPALPRSGSKAPRIDQHIVQNRQQTISSGSEKSIEVEETASDVDASVTGISAPAMATSEWLAHFHDSNPGWCDSGMDLALPNSTILPSDLETYGEGDFGFKDLTDGEHGTMGLNFDQDDTVSNINQEHQPGIPQAVLSTTQGLPLELDGVGPIPHGKIWTPQKLNGVKSESKQSCVQDLAKLNEALLREEGYVQTASAREGCLRPSPAIGQTLQHAQDLISICRRFKSASYNAHSTESQSSEWSYSDEDQNFEDFRVSHKQLCQINNLPGVSHPQHESFDSWGPRQLIPVAPTESMLDIPTKLLILSCYAHILQSFNQIFAPILEAVTKPRPYIPATLAGLHLDGFKLASHHSLQLKCLIQVSSNLLDKLESHLTGSQGQEGLLSQDRGGLLGGNILAGLTDALYEQNVRGDGQGQARVKTVIRKIEVALKFVDDL